MSPESTRIQQLQQRYQRSLDEKAKMLQDLVGQLGSDYENGVSELHGFLHQLAGSAGMYGYDDIAADCRELMRLKAAKDLIESSQLQALPDLLRKRAAS